MAIYDDETGELKGAMLMFIDDLVKKSHMRPVYKNFDLKPDSGECDAENKCTGNLDTFKNVPFDMMAMQWPLRGTLVKDKSPIILGPTGASLYRSIASNYLPPGEKTVDVLDTFTEFSCGTTLLIVATILVAICLATAAELIARRPKGIAKSARKVQAAYGNAWRIFSMLFYQNFYSFASSATTIVFLIFTLSTFIVVQYFGGFLKTELVVLKQPAVIDDFRDLLRAPQVPMFLHGEPSSADFLFPRLEIEKQILAQHRAAQFSMKIFRLPKDFITMLDHLHNRTGAIVSQSFVLQSMLTMDCSFAVDVEVKPNLYLSKGHLGESVYSALFSANISAVVHRKLSMSYQYAFEAGITEQVYEIQRLLLISKSKFFSAMLCIENSDKFESSSNEAEAVVKWKNIARVCVLCCAVQMLSVLQLFCSRWSNSKKNVKNRKLKRKKGIRKARNSNAPNVVRCQQNRRARQPRK